MVLPPLEVPVKSGGKLSETGSAILQLAQQCDRLVVMTYDHPRTTDSAYAERVQVTTPRSQVEALPTGDSSTTTVTCYPNSPHSWAHKIMSGLTTNVDPVVMRSKLLVGLPLYGWRGNDAVTGVNKCLRHFAVHHANGF